MDLKKIQNQSGKYVDYMVDTISDTIKSCGTRFSGSEGEKRPRKNWQRIWRGIAIRLKSSLLPYAPNLFTVGYSGR